MVESKKITLNLNEQKFMEEIQKETTMIYMNHAASSVEGISEIIIKDVNKS